LGEGAEEFVHAGRESRPDARHLDGAIAACRGQAVILAWVTGIGFDPLGVDKPKGAEAAEERVDRALDNDEARVGFKLAEDFEAVKRGFGEDSENREFERALAELDLPFFGAFGDGGRGLLHGTILCSAMYYVKYFLNCFLRREQQGFHGKGKGNRRRR
jgi:hypothetical protein